MKKKQRQLRNGIIFIVVLILALFFLSQSGFFSVGDISRIPHIEYSSSYNQQIIIDGNRNEIFGGEIEFLYCNTPSRYGSKGQPMAYHQAILTINNQEVLTLPTIYCGEDFPVSQPRKIIFDFDGSRLNSNNVGWDIQGVSINSATLSLFEKVECTTDEHCTSFIYLRQGQCQEDNTCKFEPVSNGNGDATPKTSMIPFMFILLFVILVVIILLMWGIIRTRKRKRKF